MSLPDLRSKIDKIDEELINLFEQRLDVSAEVAKYKLDNQQPIYDPAREREKLYEISGQVCEERRPYATALYSLLFELSKAEQERIIRPKSILAEKIESAVKETDWIFPDRTPVACQGMEGAYSQLATEKLFALPSILYFNTFESAFSAVDSGLCPYAVLPLENSIAGSINQVYDLMMRYKFSIVKSVRLKIDHCLLAKPGVEISSIKEIFSHEQAIAQCSEYLKALGCKVTVCENTAAAAKMVSESPRNDIAALSSHNCAALYELNCLAESVQDSGSNYTRFICVSKSLAIYPGADKTSLILIASHKPGSLYQILSRLYIRGINIIKLESRPIPNRDFEFMFYFDLEASVYSPALLQALDELQGLCDELYYLGTYSEVV